jgi:hypothetical protein
MPNFQQQEQKLVLFTSLEKDDMTQSLMERRRRGTKNERTYNRVLSRASRAEQWSLVHTGYIAPLRVWSRKKLYT